VTEEHAGEIRTRDLSVTSPTLCHSTYRVFCSIVCWRLIFSVVSSHTFCIDFYNYRTL